MISDKPLKVVFKNFYRNKMVNLSALSVKHFLPNAEIYCYTLYKESMAEYAEQEPLLHFITEFTAPTKFVSGKQVHDHVDASQTSGYANPQNGAFFTEGFNLIVEKFKGLEEPLLMLAEDHFFTTGRTLQELIDHDWDVAFAEWDASPPDYSNRANGSILGIVPARVEHLFPVPETFTVAIEWLIPGYILKYIPSDRLYRVTTRHGSDYREGPQYGGDGCYTNSSEVIREEMIRAGICI